MSCEDIASVEEVFDQVRQLKRQAYEERRETLAIVNRIWLLCLDLCSVPAVFRILGGNPLKNFDAADANLMAEYTPESFRDRGEALLKKAGALLEAALQDRVVAEETLERVLRYREPYLKKIRVFASVMEEVAEELGKLYLLSDQTDFVTCATVRASVLDLLLEETQLSKLREGCSIHFSLSKTEGLLDRECEKIAVLLDLAHGLLRGLRAFTR